QVADDRVGLVLRAIGEGAAAHVQARDLFVSTGRRAVIDAHLGWIDGGTRRAGQHVRAGAGGQQRDGGAKQDESNGTGHGNDSWKDHHECPTRSVNATRPAASTLADARWRHQTRACQWRQLMPPSMPITWPLM